MRGLDIRVMLAKARTMEVIHCVTSDHGLTDWMIDVEVAAESLGHMDAHRGLSEPPVMFQNEPDLLRWWRCGRETYREMREMAECHGCNNGTGDPCPHHG